MVLKGSQHGFSVSVGGECVLKEAGEKWRGQAMHVNHIKDSGPYFKSD